MTISDRYAGLSPGLLGPYIGAFAITPGSPLQEVTRALHCGGTGGTVAATFADGSTATLDIVAGATLNVRLQAVASSGTTAAGLVGLY